MASGISPDSGGLFGGLQRQVELVVSVPQHLVRKRAVAANSVRSQAEDPPLEEMVGLTLYGPKLLRLAASFFYVAVFALIFPGLYFAFGAYVDQFIGDYPRLTSDARAIVGAPFVIAGCVLVSWATGLLQSKGKGLPISSFPPQHLVMRGPYRLCRHPIYLGATLFFAGIATVIDSLGTAIVGGSMLGAFYFSYARGIEEPELVRRHGQAYGEYQRTVPLVIRFPLRQITHKLAGILLGATSAAINHPRLARYRDHILFWRYGIWPGLGVFIGLATMDFVLLTQDIASPVRSLIILVLTGTALLSIRITYRYVVAVGERRTFRSTAGKVGFVSWGVVPAIALTILGFTLFSDMAPHLILDACLPALLVAHFFGRIGCAFYGCCFGKKTESVFHLHYRDPVLKAVRETGERELRLIPTQLLSSLYGAFGAMLVFGLWICVPQPSGVPSALSLVWYGSFRISEEWLREQKRLLLGLVSPAQLVALCMLISGLAVLQFVPDSPIVLRKALHVESPVMVAGQLHLLLSLACGSATFVLFSYHREQVGKWKSARRV